MQVTCPSIVSFSFATTKCHWLMHLCNFLPCSLHDVELIEPRCSTAVTEPYAQQMSDHVFCFGDFGHCKRVSRANIIDLTCTCRSQTFDGRPTRLFSKHVLRLLTQTGQQPTHTNRHAHSALHTQIHKHLTQARSLPNSECKCSAGVNSIMPIRLDATGLQSVLKLLMSIAAPV